MPTDEPTREDNAVSTVATDPYDYAYYLASQRSLIALEPGVEYTLVKHRDNSDAGTAECYFTDESEASRYVTAIKAAFEAGDLGNETHPQPPALHLAVYTVVRR